MILEKIQNLKNSESQKLRISELQNSKNKKTQKDFSEFLFSEVLNF